MLTPAIATSATAVAASAVSGFMPAAIVTTASSAAASASGLVLPALASVCAGLAPPTSVALSAAPLLTFHQIRRNRSVGDLPLLPYTAMAANCALWTTYGFLQRQTALWVPNLVGLLLATHYFASYVQFAAPKGETSSPVGSIQQHAAALAAVAAFTAAAVLCSVNPALIGRAAVLFCVALFASPLATLRTVLRTKSAQSIPLPFTIASVASCFCWTVTGALRMRCDWNVILPNALGLLCGLAQVVLKLRYGDREPQLPVQMEEEWEPSPTEPGYAVAALATP